RPLFSFAPIGLCPLNKPQSEPRASASVRNLLLRRNRTPPAGSNPQLIRSPVIVRNRPPPDLVHQLPFGHIPVLVPIRAPQNLAELLSGRSALRGRDPPIPVS